MGFRHHREQVGQKAAATAALRPGFGAHQPITDWTGQLNLHRKRSAPLLSAPRPPAQPQRALRRTLEFWLRAIPIYGSYKICQFRTQFLSKEAQEQVWEDQHEWAAGELFSLCSELGGFFLKVSQLVGKPDLAPKAWVKKLVTLCDSAPATPFPIVKHVLENELGSTIEEMFEEFQHNPIGSASVAQVHRARMKGAKKDVAVKVQHPGIEVLMMTDIHNLRAFATFLQRFDLKFDTISVVDELEEQVGLEFDFQREARSMDRIADSFANFYQENPPVQVPRSLPGLATRRALIMQFIEGTPIIKLGDEMAKRGINPSGAMARLAKWNILKDLAEAYGHMILRDGFFQADPHPGNILILKKGKVGLLDYGQVKELSGQTRLDYAKLVLALNSQNVHEVAKSFKKLGLVLGTDVESDPKSFLLLASSLFDTKLPPGQTKNDPFAENSVLKKVPVNNFPKDLFFVLRTMQILRGLSVGMEIPFSCVDAWKDLAKEAVSTSSCIRQRNRKGQRELMWERRKRSRRLFFLHRA